MNKKILMIACGILLGIAAISLLYKLIISSGSPQAPAGKIAIGEKGTLLDGARKSLQKGDDDAAIKACEELIAKYPDSPEAQEAIVSMASIYEKRQDLLKVKELYQKAIEKFPDSKDIEKLQEALGTLNIKILFSPIIEPDSFLYEIEKGDTLVEIAKKFGTTVELIQRANNLTDGAIKFGRKLKITKARFSVVVDKSQNILTLKSDGNILKTYRVSTGKDFSTPTGNFTIRNKITDPTWYTVGSVVGPGSPNNILGSRWMGISKQGYGIHGTTESKSIGKQVTAGCVRMTNPEVEELYSILPAGAEVVIVD